MNLIKGFNRSILLCIILLFSSCVRDYTKLDPVEPYPKATDDVLKFSVRDQSEPPVNSGDVLKLLVSGLDKAPDLFIVYMNELPCEVIGFDSVSVTVRVPDSVSSGLCSIKTGEEVYYGPYIEIKNNLILFSQSDFLSTASSSGLGSIPLFSDGTNPSFFLVWGNNADFLSTWAGPLRTSKLTLGLVNEVYWVGAIGYQRITPTQNARNTSLIGNQINDVLDLGRGEFIVSGDFSGAYVGQSGDEKVVKLNSVCKYVRGDFNGLDLARNPQTVFNETPLETPGEDIIYASSLNGGVFGTITKTVSVSTGQGLISIGKFRKYVQVDYASSTNKNLRQIEIPVNDIVKYDITGAFDSTFNFDKTQLRPKSAANGRINSCIALPTGNVLLVGKFSKYNDTYTNNIVAIDESTGEVSNSINFGSGANGEITSITYNPITKKILIAGRFTMFNGMAYRDVVLLNEDGSVDAGFTFRGIDQGEINYAYQLKTTEIIICGSFIKYGNIPRSGMAFLNSDGSLSEQYNKMGGVEGKVTCISSHHSSKHPEQFTLIVSGEIKYFAGKPVKNMAIVVKKR